MEKRICKTCGKEYEKNYKYSETQWAFSKFCSYACNAKNKKIRADNKIQPKKICEFCGKEYIRNRTLSPHQWDSRRFCSNYCGINSRRKHKDARAKDLFHRRKRGILPQGSPALKAKIAKLTALAMQRPDVQEKIRAPRESLSLERRMQISNTNKGKMPKNLGYTNCNHYPNVKRGYYDINGTTMYFRSGWEANYALYLDFLIDHNEIVKWEYEPDTFMFEQIKLGTRSYTPDFKVFNKDGTIEYHEVKGHMNSKSKTKLKRMKKYYPKVVLKLIDSSEYNLLKKQIGKLCNFY
jgi:hypothetical protein